MARVEFYVVAVKYAHPQLSGTVTLAEVGGSAVAEIPVQAAQLKAYYIGRRVRLTWEPA